jgi:hypothetical protein
MNQTAYASPGITSSGTIGLVSGHRIRLTDEEIAELVTCLQARAAMRTGVRLARVLSLIARLRDGQSGNPDWRLGAEREALAAEHPGVRSAARGVARI